MQHPVPSVRAIISDEKGRVLLLERAHDSAYGAGAWCLPGGKVDYGESVESVVRREIQEETSLECFGTEFLFYQDSLPIAPGTMHVVNLYFACAVRGSIALNEESASHAWVGRDEMEKYSIVFRNDEAMLRYWDVMESPA